MTYKEIVDRVREVVEAHKQLVDFGYGSLSDIKTNGDDKEADYPYVFLNPTTHTRTGQSITYRFNMIVMEMVPDADYLIGQSECQQYIDDILSQLRFAYTDQVDLTLNVTLTPFKERFQDTVAGMTATLEFVIPVKLDQCIAPFEPYYTQYVHVYSNQDRINDPDAPSQTYVFDVIVENDGSYTALPGAGNRWYPPTAGTYKLQLTGQFKLNEPGTISQGPALYHQSPYQVHFPDTLTGWPTAFESVDTVYDVTAEWILEHPGEGEYEIAALYNAPAIEAEMTVLSGLTYKIYRAD